MSEFKQVTGVEVKDRDQGIVKVQFATYDEIDHHGDVTQKGAFKDGAAVRVSAYNHASWGPGSLPVGKGVIKDTDSGPTAELQYFMNTSAGRETFETVKSMGDLQQWSYGFDVKESSEGKFQDEDVRFLKSMEVHEISPVLLGAGKSTSTLDVKTKDGHQMTLKDHLNTVVADVESVVGRAAEVKAMRHEKGKDIGEESTTVLERLEGQLDELRSLLKPDDTTPSTPPEGGEETTDDEAASVIAAALFNLEEDDSEQG